MTEVTTSPRIERVQLQLEPPRPPEPPKEMPPDLQDIIRAREAEKPRDLRVVVPYTNLHPGVELAIRSAGYMPELRKTPGLYGYWELLCELWADQRDFILIEHDIIAGPEVFENFESCSEWWCANPYNLGRAVIDLYAFGAVRFRHPLMKMEPDVMLDMPVVDRFWETLDERVQWHLQGVGAARHPHKPSVVNLNPRYFRGVYEV